MVRSWLLRLWALKAEALDRSVGWHRLPALPGLATLIGIRDRLRARNLYDTSPTAPTRQPTPENDRYLTTRTPDGTFNDLENPAMGSANTRFGRNVPLKHTYPESDWAILNTPNPRTVSRELLTRNAFKPATTLNLLAASWLQFMVRDWLTHGKGTMQNVWEPKLGKDDPWPRDRRPMRIPRTPAAPHSLDDTSPPTYLNTETHWWDGSQIYGSNQESQDWVRSKDGQKLEDGKLNDDLDSLLPADADPKKNPANEPGFWVGLAMMNILFRKEHNAICDHLRARHPSWSSDELFERARLVNAALMAKIHTVEWTPAILDHPTLQIAMKANWQGLAGEVIYEILGRISGREEVNYGIPGSEKNHFGVPYSITEEFVAVYKMHPLIPDYFDFRSATTDKQYREHPYTLREVQDKNVRERLKQVPMQDLFYSFGIAHPGAITLHNYPRFLQEFERPDGNLMDLAATDILRMRELGVPRYNEFRKLLHRPPVRTFEELTDNPAWAEEIRHVYDDDIDQVDLMVGLYAEPVPQGFAFSDTTFRIFILMASRRLNSDRFFTTDYTPRVYTQAGLDWINDNDMSTVLLRHFPELQHSLRGIKNPFAPWPRVTPPEKERRE